MQKPVFVLFASILAISGRPAFAHSSKDDEVAELRRQVEALQQSVRALQQQVNEGRLAPVFSDRGSLNGGGKNVIAASDTTSPAPPPAVSGSSLFNPEISVAIDAIGSYSRRADNVNFLVRDAELMLNGNVGNLARAYIVINAESELEPLEKSDPFEEISLEIEEAAVETTSLPWGLQLKAGQFFADVTRLGKVHSHDLPFTDRPRSLDLLAGGETKARGLELDWHLPIGHDVRFTAGIVDNVGAEPPALRRFTTLEAEEQDSNLFAERTGGGRGFDDLTYYVRATTIFELRPQINLSVGANYLRGRDTGTRQLTSGDFKLTWTPSPESFDLFELSGEYLWARQSGRLTDNFALVDEEKGFFRPVSATAKGHGGYVYAQYRFGKFFQPGIRFDYINADRFTEVDSDGDGKRDMLSRFAGDTATFSAYANFHFTELNRLRLQVNYVKGEQGDFAGAGDDWQAFVQWTVILGPHSSDDGHSHH